MKIGVSINYKKIGKLKPLLEESNVNIDHVQLNGLPADTKEIETDILNQMKNFHSQNPDIQLSLHAYPFNFAEKVEKVRKVWLELAKETIQLANNIGASFVNFHGGYGIDASSRLEHNGYRKLIVSAMEELLNTSKPYGIEIHLENLYPESRNSDFTKLGDRLRDFKYFFNAISNPLFKLCYDYGHGNLDAYGINILREYSHRLGSIHAHDNDQVSDIHWHIGEKGLGTINWDEEIEYLRGIEFKGSFILESYIEDQMKSLKYLKRKGF